MYTSQLAIEALVVGIILGISLALIVRAGFPLKTPSTALGVGIALGACIHLGFELLGLNARYCSTGAACMKP